MIVPRNQSNFPRTKGLESCRGWIRSYFYVKCITTADKIRLPIFALGVPGKVNWELNPKNTNAEINQIDVEIINLKKQGLTGDDLLATFISRRISPLQLRTHKICHMSGRHDSNRFSTFELTKSQVWKRVWAIATTPMTVDWEYGKAPYDRAHPAPVVSTCFNRHPLHSGIAIMPISFLHCFLVLPLAEAPPTGERGWRSWTPHVGSGSR
jgi:hypothetical protein